MAVSTAKVLMRRYPKEVGKVDIENSEWAKSLFKRMNYRRRKAETAKLPMPPGIYKENELLFHHQIVETVEAYGIPNSMILNFDQTPCKYVSVPTTTLAERNSKQVAIKGIDDKRAITATFTITLDGNFLGMQLIYGGKTNQSLPQYQFPKEFSISVNLKQYSNENESLKLIDEIILPYLMRERERLNRPTQKALVILDVFRGQMTDKVLDHFKENSIATVFVPANITDQLQPLDLTVNGYDKKYCKKKFNEWYMEQITKQLDSGKPINEIEVKLQLTTLKPLHAEWLTDFYNLMTTSEGKDVILSGWKAAGIIQVIKKGSSQLESLDPFKDLDPLLSPASYNETINPTMLSDEVRQAFIDSAEIQHEADGSDSEDNDVYVPDDNQNIFNIFKDIGSESYTRYFLFFIIHFSIYYHV